MKNTLPTSDLEKFAGDLAHEIIEKFLTTKAVDGGEQECTAIALQALQELRNSDKKGEGSR